MPQHALLHRDLGCRHLPRIGRRRDEHRSRRGTGFAHLLIRVRHCSRATRALDAEREVLVEIVVRRRALGAHLRPVRIELLRHERGEAGVRTLAHFQVLDHHGDRIVRRDLDEAGRIDRLHAGGANDRRGARALRERIEPDDEADAEAPADAQEVAARDRLACKLAK